MTQSSPVADAEPLELVFAACHLIKLTAGVVHVRLDRSLLSSLATKQMTCARSGTHQELSSPVDVEWRAATGSVPLEDPETALRRLFAISYSWRLVVDGGGFSFIGGGGANRVDVTTSRVSASSLMAHASADKAATDSETTPLELLGSVVLCPGTVAGQPFADAETLKAMVAELLPEVTARSIAADMQAHIDAESPPSASTLPAVKRAARNL